MRDMNFSKERRPKLEHIWTVFQILNNIQIHCSPKTSGCVCFQAEVDIRVLLYLGYSRAYLALGNQQSKPQESPFSNLINGVNLKLFWQTLQNKFRR